MVTWPPLCWPELVDTDDADWGENDNVLPLLTPADGIEADDDWPPFLVEKVNADEDWLFFTPAMLPEFDAVFWPAAPLEVDVDCPPFAPFEVGDDFP